MGKGVMNCVTGECHHILWQLPQYLCPDGGCLIIKPARDITLHLELLAVLQTSVVVGSCDPVLHSPDDLSFEAPGSSFRITITSWWGFKAALMDVSSATVFQLAMYRTIESREYIWEVATPHLVFL